MPFVNKSRRLKNYNYSQSGHYFVTTVAKNRTPCFGKIVNQKMILNSYGQIVYNQWLWLGQNSPFIRLDEFTVMPDHFHGVLEIVELSSDIDLKIHHARRYHPRVVPTNTVIPTNAIVTQTIENEIYNRRYNLLSKTMNAFKTTSSKLIHQAGLIDFKWQKSFYDHIIRDDESLNRIRFYIKNNAVHHSR